MRLTHLVPGLMLLGAAMLLASPESLTNPVDEDGALQWTSVANAQDSSKAIAGACSEGPADSVAAEVLRTLIIKSVQENREYAGWIYYSSSEKKYCYTAPKPGSAIKSDPGPAPGGAVGVYHTHGNWRGGEYGDPNYDEHFSWEDQIQLHLDRIIGWLGTPKGDMRKFVPCSVEKVPGCDQDGKVGTETRLAH